MSICPFLTNAAERASLKYKPYIFLEICVKMKLWNTFTLEQLNGAQSLTNNICTDGGVYQ
jgi:hypothetical protein